MSLRGWLWAFLHLDYKFVGGGVSFCKFMDQTITDRASLWTPDAFTSKEYLVKINQD